ncbi:MAG: hypothetical protein Q8N47_14025 [Bryobacterales bacterium]|nr:hypothetical protein [Bryobacterales bacterium]
MATHNLLPKLLAELRTGIKAFPEGFYDSFKYTKTGSNFTHPWTIGLLSRILWSLDGITEVGIDVRINRPDGAKFQPDLVAYRERKPVLLVDYESPNSSDARVRDKDVKPYLKWVAGEEGRAEYIIITTLPDRHCPRWEVRYTSKGQCNQNVRDKRDEIRQNPFGFWYSEYRRTLRDTPLGALSFVNIDGRRVTPVRDVGA